MTRALSSAARRLGDATRAAASWLGKRPKPSAKSARKVPERSGALRSGVIEDAPASVELDAARLAADEGQAALAQVLADPDPVRRARALSLIVELSERRATRLLRAMMFDPDAAVRRAAASSAARIEGLGVAVALIVALDDPDADVRRAAARALTQVTGQEVELDPASFSVAAERRSELRRWWREQRVEELVSAAHQRERAAQ